MLKSVNTGQNIIQRHADAVEEPFPPPVKRDYKREIMCQMRSIIQQDVTLAQCFTDESQIALLQIADTAMDEFGAAARCSAGEIPLFQEQGAVAAAESIHCSA